MTTFDTYEMLDSWYESIKGEKTLSLQEAKGLVQDIGACDSLKKKEELKTLDVNVFLLENVRIREQLETVDEKFRIANDDLTDTRAHYDNIKEDYEKVQSELELLEEAINSARETLSNTGVMRERLEGEINVLKEQINSAHSNAEHLLNRKKSVLADIEGKDKDKEGILADKEDIDSKVIAPVMEYLESCSDDYSVLIMPDHPTPLDIKTHSSKPVPYLIYDSRKEKEGTCCFTENNAALSGIFIEHGPDIMKKLLEK